MNTDNTIEIDVRVEFRDYLKANYWFMFQRSKLLLVILFIGAVVYPLLLVTRLTSGAQPTQYWAYLIPWGVLVIMFGGTYVSAKRQMASNRGLRENVHFVFSERGIEMTSSSSSGRTDWTNVYEAHETRSNFLIFLSRNLMYTIPKRYFHSAEQVEALRQLLRSQLQTKAKWK